MSTGFKREKMQNPTLREQLGRARAATPVNAVAATGTLTFTGVAIDTQTVTIGDDVYEFDTDSTYTAGNIPVDISGGATAPAAVTALVAAITANTASLFDAADGAGDTVVLTAKTKGTASNGIATTETCTNASWGAAVTASGVDGTPGLSGELAYDASYLYVFNGADNLSLSADAWERVSTSAY
jgi:phage tail sheath gpL-like